MAGVERTEGHPPSGLSGDTLGPRLGERLRQFFDAREEVLLAYLFGSIVDPVRTSPRDIDVGVLVTPGEVETRDDTQAYGYAAAMTVDLARILRFKKVDLTILNHAPPLLLRRVIRTGRMVFCRGECHRIRFEIAALKRFADTVHLRAIKRRYMRERILRGLDAYGGQRTH